MAGEENSAADIETRSPKACRNCIRAFGGRSPSFKRVVFMPRRTGNHLNAFKHGAFAKIAFLPWEDPQEFARLHAALKKEWMPDGPTERNTVFSIAMGMWRKRRMQYFLHARIEECKYDPKHLGYDEATVLRLFPLS